jgi:hypothetical protein
MRRICIGFLFLCFYLSSCTHLRDFPHEGEFEGIKTALDRDSCVSVLMVHGVGGYPDGDPDTLILAIKNKLNLWEDGEACVREIADDHSGCNMVYGYLTRRDFHGVNKPYNLRIYSLDWLNATWLIKGTLECVDKKNDDERVAIAKLLKREVVTKNIVDAILYTSDYRSEIQYPVIQTIRWIQEDAKDDCHHENIVVGFSLGSSMVIETLDTMLGHSEKAVSLDNNKQVAGQFIDQLSQFFMLSNVTPFFELLETRSKDQAKYYDKKTCNAPTACETYELPEDCKLTLRGRATGRFIMKKRETCPNFQIVAFNDPNDPLGYLLEDNDFPLECKWSRPFINERVRNVKWSFFGFINPIEAHIGYAQNNEVAKMIIYGLHDAYNSPTPQCCEE